MANNYFIEGNGEIDSLGRAIFKTSENKGDSTFDGSMVTSGALIVQPNAGYTVAAADFSISNLSTLTTPYLDNGEENPDYKWVEGITIADTGTPGTISNTIRITVSLVTSGPRGPLVLSSNFTIGLDIDGDALVNNVPENVAFNIPIINQNNAANQFAGSDTDINANATVTLTPESGVSINTVANGEFSEMTLAGQVAPDEPTNVGNINIAANAGYYFQETPYLSYVDTPSDIIALNSPTITYNSDNLATAFSFNVVYKNSVDTTNNSQSKTFVRYKTTQIPTATKEIQDIKFGQTQVSNRGDMRNITVHGDADAEFDITIQDSRSVSIIDSNLSNKKTLTGDIAESDAISKKLKSTGRKKGKTSYKFDQEFPAYKSLIRDTALNMGGGLSGTKAIFTSLTSVAVGDRVMMDEIPNSTEVTVSALNPDGDNVNECTLSSSVTASNGSKVRFHRPQTYYINIYPREGTTLSSRIPTVTPHYTIKQYDDPILTLKTKETDAGYAAIGTYKYTGKANAHPSQLKDTPRMFSCKITGTRSDGGTFAAVGATSGIPTWSSTDSTVSSWSNSTYADNGGMHIEIFNIAVSGIGGASYVLTFEVLIKRWGTEDVTMILDLDTIIT